MCAMFAAMLLIYGHTLRAFCAQLTSDLLAIANFLLDHAVDSAWVQVIKNIIIVEYIIFFLKSTIHLTEVQV